MRTNEEIYHLRKRIGNVQAKIHALKHFKRRDRNRIFILDCWCGLTFASPYIDARDEDLDRLIEFVNDHAACPPKGQP